MKFALVAGGLLFAGPALADNACEALRLQQALALVPMSDCNVAPRRPVPIIRVPSSKYDAADVAALETRIQALEHRVALVEAELMAERNR